MGSWSVYCGISNITITENTKVVLVPLHFDENISETNDTFHYTLPIFGEYNDYGGIKNIEKDDNTLLIEKIHNCTIEDFCNCLITNDFTSVKNIKKLLKGVNYMWINREIYDYMVNYHPTGWRRKGYLPLGYPEVLKYLGFNLKDGTDKRNQIWELNNNIVISNGNQLNGISKLEDLKNICGVEFPLVNDLEKENLFFLYDKFQRLEMLTNTLGIDKYIIQLGIDKYHLDSIKNIDIYDEDDHFNKKLTLLRPMTKAYIDNIMNDNICKQLSFLTTLRKNMYVGSYSLKPFKHYITPQCGEFEMHQSILEKFVEINKKHIND